MTRPFVPPRIEQRRQFPCICREATDVRTLKRVTIKATQTQVAGGGRPLMLLRDDMIDLEGCRVEILGHPAVFATMPCALPDQPDQRPLHQRLRRGCVSSA